MKGCMVLVVFIGICVASAQAQMVLWEDFEGYTLGTIHNQGDDLFTGDRWQVQRNSSILGDPGWVTVIDVDGDKMLKMTNRDLTGAVDTIYLSMSMSSQAITDDGTIYVRFKADGPNDTLLCTNDKWPGWDYGAVESGDAGAPNFQGTTNYSEQGVIVRLSGGEDFRARDGSENNPSPTGISGYKNVAMGQQADAWQELWIQVDHDDANDGTPDPHPDRVKFYLCPDGGTPTVVPNPDGGEWWSMRNQDRDNNAVTVLKWMIGLYPWPGTHPTNVIIESIGIDTQAMTTDRFYIPCIHCHPYCDGDADADGDVDLDDFVILKTNFGTTTGADCSTGDFDGDGDVDLDDFVILKTYFGS